MASGAYFEIEARVVAPGVVARVAALIEPAAQDIERRLQEAIRRGLNGGGSTRLPGTRQGAEFGDAFSRALKTRLEAAFRSLPKVKIDANSSDVDREIADIRRKLQAAGRAIDIGVDDGKVTARLDELRARLERLARTSPDIRVRVNTGTALAELEALKRSMDGFDGRGSRVRRLFSGDLFGDAFRSLGTWLRNSNGLLDSTLGKLGGLGDKIKGISDEATAGAKSNPIVGLITSNVLITAVVLALTTVGPLIAAAAGATLGLAGAAAGALLAFKGLQNQMSLNVGYGRQLQTAFSGVMAIVGRLGSVVADAIGPGLVGAVNIIKNALPSFGGLFRVVGTQLGAISRSVATTLVNVFRNAQPIILQVVEYIRIGAAKLADWTGSESFQKFLAYASRELPVVGSAIGAIGKLLISAFVAFAPVGEGVLRVLTGIANIASGVFNVVGKVIDFFSGNTSTNQSTSALQQTIAQLQALGTVSVVTGQASTGLAAMLGTTNGAYKTAQDAAKANADQLAATTVQMQIQNDAAGLLKQSLDQLSGKRIGAAESLNTLQQQIGGLGDVFNKGTFTADTSVATKSVLDQRDALLQAVGAAQAYAVAVADQAVATGNAAGAQALGTQALKDGIQSIIDGTNKTGAQKQAVSDYIGTLIDLNNLKVPPTLIQAQTEDAQAALARFSSAVTGLPDGTIEVHASTETAAAAIQRFVSTPRTAYVQVQTIGPTGGSGGRAVLNAQGSIIKAFAGGGMVSASMAAKLAASAPSFAGGIERHIPQISRPNGLVRFWAEPETKGESYIPLANDWRRPRALQIWAQTGQELGVMASAAGASQAAAAGPDYGLHQRIDVLTQVVAASSQQNAAMIGDAYRESVATSNRRQDLAGSNAPRTGY